MSGDPVTSAQPRLGGPAGDRHRLDYDLDDYVMADTPEALKALGDPTRTLILALLMERAATTTHLADALGKPKGTVGYHLKVLEEAGLVRIVRRRRVRALIEKYYGRVGRTVVYRGRPGDSKLFMLQEAMDEASVDDDGSPLPMFTVRRVRISEDRAMEFSQRVLELAEDFVALPRSGGTVYGFVAGVYPTDHPVLPDTDEEGRR